MQTAVKAEELALVQGLDHTKATLRVWNAAPMAILRPWAAGSFAIAALLLFSVWVVATQSEPDPSGLSYAGVTREVFPFDYPYVLFRNSLVLALHSLSCVAGFIAASSLPVVAEGHTGWWRKAHDIAGPFAILFVTAATLFSLGTQAYVIGGSAATLSHQLGMSELELILALTPHALPELFALFLPLAAWVIASRRGQWEQLLAATIVTTAIAAPLLLTAAAVEVWVTPRVILALTG